MKASAENTDPRVELPADREQREERAWANRRCLRCDMLIAEDYTAPIGLCGECDVEEEGE